MYDTLTCEIKLFLFSFFYWLYKIDETNLENVQIGRNGLDGYCAKNW